MGITGRRHQEIYDLVGIGFGPSNLSLAIALEEHGASAAQHPVKSHFFERQPTFGWHRNMLLPSTTMQISFLKDLVTFRNPLSRFSFVSYLHAANRLVQFVNNQDFFPTRHEFHQYLEWAAAGLDNQVTYGAEVISIRPVAENGAKAPDLLEIEVRESDGSTQVVTARNVAISTGLVPRLPEGMTADERVWHSSEFLGRFNAHAPEDLRSVAVVGATRARPRSPGSSTTRCRTPRSPRSSRRTATPSPTTPPSPTRCSIPARSTSTSSGPIRRGTRSGVITATPTTRWSTPTSSARCTNARTTRRCATADGCTSAT